MNKEIKKKWIKALRSGKYEQAQEALCQYDSKGNVRGYSCLGVLTHIVSPDHRLLLRALESPYKSVGLDLPMFVATKAGLDNVNPEIDPVIVGARHCDTLAEANDHGASFEEIADIIEEQL